MIEILEKAVAAPPRRHAREDASKVERARYSYCDGEHELVLFSPGVDDRLVEAIAEGETEFALAVDDPLILFGARFGETIPWTVAPYCWHLSPRESRTIPPVEKPLAESRALLQIRLIDTQTGQARAVRNVTLWLQFTRVLHEAIREQARPSFDPREHDRALTRFRRRFPTDECVAAAAVVRSPGSP